MSWQSGFLRGRSQTAERAPLGFNTVRFSLKGSRRGRCFRNFAGADYRFVRVSPERVVSLFLSLRVCFGVEVVQIFLLMMAAASWAGKSGSQQGARGMAQRLQNGRSAGTATGKREGAYSSKGHGQANYR